VGDTTQVGRYLYAASLYGALDMAGNVWEWVSDWWQSDYYSVSPPNNPPGPASGTYKVARGGAFFSNWDNVRVAGRIYFNPVNSSNGIGFRCAGVARTVIFLPLRSIL
jgi:formylglycine-generating enzyme required for sulfatase activity